MTTYICSNCKAEHTPYYDDHVELLDFRCSYCGAINLKVGPCPNNNEEILNPYPNKEELDPFRKLRDVLELAYDQCANGKGKERHNPEGTTPFEEQPIMETTRAHGLGHPTGQAEKKLREAHNLIELRGYAAAINEILGAIVYSCAAVVYLQEERDKNKSTKTLSELLREGLINE